MSFGLRLALGICALGAVMIIAPIALPRSWFGELGHGDGMGMIGLIMFGALVLGAGVVALIISALIYNRNVAAAHDTGGDAGEEK